MSIRKQAILNTIGNIVYFVSLWLLTIITTRVLGYEAVGYLTLAMAIGNTVANLQFYGVRGYQSSDMTFNFSSFDYVKARVVTIILGLIIGLMFCVIMDYSLQLCCTIFLFMLIKSSESFSDVLFGNVQRYGRLDLAGYSMFIRGMIVAFLFLVRAFSSLQLNDALLFVSMGVILISLFIDLPIHNIIIKEKEEFFSKGVSDILRECFPLFLTATIPVFIIAVPRIVLERLYGAEILGLYGNVSTPALLITTVVPTILTALLPSYGKSYVSRDFCSIFKIWKNSILGTLILTIMCLFGTALFAQQVLVFVYTEKILSHIHYLKYVLIAMAIYALVMCNYTLLVSMRKKGIIIFSSMLGLVLCCMTSFPLIHTYAINGAIAVLILSYGIQTIVQIIWILFFWKRLQKRSIYY